MSAESEGNPITGSDIAGIVTRLNGWKIKATEQSTTLLVFGRDISDGRHLELRIDSSEGSVVFRELVPPTYGMYFSIECPSISRVSFDKLADQIEFDGDVLYRIKRHGLTHEVLLPNNQHLIVSRSYPNQ